MLSGTVFREALIWEIDVNAASQNNVAVLKRLQGHQGVIFDARFLQGTDANEVATVSDDRTVRVWNVDDGQAKLELYGHRSRIWAVR